jgi:hypothetical protein
MNTEQRARFEAWAKEQGRTTGTLDGIRYFDPFVRGLWTAFQAAETPLLARIAELEGQLANREPFVVKLPEPHKKFMDDESCAQFGAMSFNNGRYGMARFNHGLEAARAAITAAGGVCE